MLRFGYLCYLRDSVSRVTEIRIPRQAKRTFNRSVIRAKASTSGTMTSDLDIKKCFEVAKKLTLEAGKIFKIGFEGEKIIESKEASWDLVTDYDRSIEKFLIEGIKEEFPDHEFIAEETAAETGSTPELTNKPTWILDPIDGTINYVHSFPGACICLGLAVSKDLVLGIIYDVAHSDIYTAIKGEGAYLNNKPIRTSKITELKDSLIDLEPHTLRYSTKNRDIQLGRFEALVSATQGCRCTGSAALSLVYVARGILDCFHMDSLKPWDVAGAVVIIREAGGTVIDTKGDEFNVMKPNTIAAANDTLAAEIKQLIVDTDLKVLRKRLSRT